MQSTYALLLLAQWGYGSSTLGFVLLASGFVIAIAQGLGGKIPSPHFERAAVLGAAGMSTSSYMQPSPVVRRGGGSLSLSWR